MTKNKWSTLGLAFAGLMISGPADAVPVGSTRVTLPGATYSYTAPYVHRPELGGSVIRDELRTLDSSVCTNVPFGTTVGTVQLRVVEESNTHHLDFYYRIVLNSTAVQVLWMKVSGMTGTSFDMDWRADGLGAVSPEAIVDNSKPGFLFDQAGHRLGDTSSNLESRFMLIHTTATGTPNVAGTVTVDGSGNMTCTLTGAFLPPP